MAFEIVGKYRYEWVDDRVNSFSLVPQLDPFESSDPFSSSSISSKGSGET